MNSTLKLQTVLLTEWIFSPKSLHEPLFLLFSSEVLGFHGSVWQLEPKYFLVCCSKMSLQITLCFSVAGLLYHVIEREATAVQE